MYKFALVNQLGFIALLSFVLTFTVHAQPDSRGAVSGTVSNSSGAPMVNSTVQLESIDNGAKRQATSDASGKYRFDDVEPGRYRMSTTLNGVASTPSGEVDVMPATVLVVDLTIGEPSRTVATTSPVTAVEQASPVEDLAGPRIQTGWNTRYNEYLPTTDYLARNGAFFGAYNLSLLSAGVASNGGIGPGRGPVVGGQPPFANNFYVAGIDNTNISSPGPLAGVSSDATSEFVSFQNQFPPEYGHASGGQFDTFLRTGTNQVHGALFEYWQNKDLDALDQSVVRDGITGNPRYDQNRLGGNIGTPLWQDKAFLFADFEYIPLGFDAVPVSPVYSPTAAGYATLAGMRGVSGTNLQLLQGVLPAASNGTAFTTVNGVQIPIGAASLFGKAYQNQYNGVSAFDWKIRQSDSLLARLSLNDLLANSNGAALPSFFSPLHMRAITSSVSEVHDFAGGSINEVRLGYTRFDENATGSNLTFPGLNTTGFPLISFEDLNAELGQGLAGPQQAALSTYDLADNFHWNIGHHTLRVGFDGRRFIGPETFSQLGAGSYIYSSVGGFLSNLPPDVSGVRAIGNPTYQTNQWDSYAYIKDEMRLSPNFELDLGLRYEFVSLPAYLRQQADNSIANAGGLNFGVPGTQRTGFAPQVGLAYSPGLIKNSVFRAGFGMNYDASPYTQFAPLFAASTATNLYTNGLSNTPGFFGSTGFFSPTYGSGLSPQALTTSYIADQRLPYTMQWNAEWQQAVKRFVLTVRYLGVRGVHLPALGLLNGSSVVSASTNLPLYYSMPSQATLNGLSTTLSGLQSAALASNPLAAAGFTNPILEMTTEGNSLYNGLSEQASQRFSGGFQFIAAYTWSHMIDDVSSPLVAPIPTMSFIDQLGARGSSLYDHRQRGTMTWLWDVGAAFGSKGGVVRDVFANFNFSGTYIYETPAPLPIVNGYGAGFTSLLGTPGVVVNPGGIAGIGSGVASLTNSFGQTAAYLANNPSAQYISGAPGMYSGTGRITFPGLRPINDFDLSAVKGFGVRDKFNFEIRADAYNVFNHPQFTPGELSNIGLPAVSQTLSYLMPGSPAFGNPEAALSNHPRMLQLALRLVF